MKYVSLILDDEPQSISILKSVLRSLDFEVITAITPDEASVKLGESLPHLLFVDIGLGEDFTGLDWLDQIRSGPYSHIPVVMMTASARASDVHRAIRLGADDYLIKPANQVLLTKRILSLLERRISDLYFASSETAPGLTAELERVGQITGISETGVCIQSHVVDFSTEEELNYSTKLFSRIGVKNPRLRYTNTGSKTQQPPGRSNLSRSYFQIQGWAEAERKVLRHWLLNKQLKAVE